MTIRLEIQILPVLALLCACTHDPALDGVVGAPPGLAGEVVPTPFEEPAGPCPGSRWLASPAQVAATPRPDELAELLALEAGTGLTAGQNVYERISADLGAILAMDASLPDAYSIGDADPQGLILLVEAETRAAIEAGTYEAWDCLNAYYGMSDFHVSAYTSGVSLRFEGRYDTGLLVPEYGGLPGVFHVEQESYVIGGSGPSSIRLEIEAGAHHYLFLDTRDSFGPGSGLVYSYYLTVRAGEPILGGRWNGVGPEPDWLGTFL